ncbi:MAG: hypothetical protein GC137_03950 [Alphaproteobacteria bacterium]|nr:hypothetical protein [Alphaproteobacteria bacterium]
MQKFSSFLSFLLILAFATAGISPACNWVSGKTMLMEICTADGTVKTIEVSAAEYGFEEEKPQQITHLKNDCAFCFSFDHQTLGLSVHDVKIANNPDVKTVTVSLNTLISKTYSYNHARGPPALFS